MLRFRQALGCKTASAPAAAGDAGGPAIDEEAPANVGEAAGYETSGGEAAKLLTGVTAASGMTSATVGAPRGEVIQSLIDQLRPLAASGDRFCNAVS